MCTYVCVRVCGVQFITTPWTSDSSSGIFHLRERLEDDEKKVAEEEEGFRTGREGKDRIPTGIYLGNWIKRIRTQDSGGKSLPQDWTPFFTTCISGFS